ncbi:N-acetyltransferase 9-like protein, partial [Euwallacea fornicatus]|uniref:N-acetyltransferase 9-like protein n=1 Tax=Euwallacea fornicatus TaxID=995702 RepID=UPI00338F8F85
MLINKHTTIRGSKVVLVPYKKMHVPKYHEWMKSEELQSLTASEPLTIEEEYDMQKSWQIDENKCTFIVLDKPTWETTGSEVDAMIGDTNLFFATPEDRLCAEAEIMIAEPWARGRKCGWQAMLLMFLYSITYLEVKQFVVKVSFGNAPSLKMFQNMGFIELSQSHVFQEITLGKVVDDTWIGWLRGCAGEFQVENKSQEYRV